MIALNYPSKIYECFAKDVVKLEIKKAFISSI